ncbi:MAG: rRNA maturation RNase YbeY [Chitinispirillaceae bacterium]|nr:rRNA maturation RNase YbeY [Chitinispirillaceae bacterium]
MRSSPSPFRKTPVEKPLRLLREDRSLSLPSKRLHECAAQLYTAEQVPLVQKTSLIFCSNGRIRSLNAAYRGIDRATDVLSFTYDDPDLLGEIYLSIPRAAAQAREYGLTVHEEIIRLFIHGFLHLLGYDHIKKADRLAMEKKEKNYRTPNVP